VVVFGRLSSGETSLDAINKMKKQIEKQNKTNKKLAESPIQSESDKKLKVVSCSKIITFKIKLRYS
jgi:hypothetical protein